MMLARVMVLACVMVLTIGMVLTMTRDGQEDAGICGSCRLCAYSWMCGCGSRWKSHPQYPRRNICKKITFFGPEVGQLIIIVHPFLVLSIFRNTSLTLFKLLTWLCYGLSPCYGVYPCYGVNICFGVILMCYVVSPCYGVIWCYEVSLCYGVSPC